MHKFTSFGNKDRSEISMVNLFNQHFDFKLLFYLTEIYEYFKLETKNKSKFDINIWVWAIKIPIILLFIQHFHDFKLLFYSIETYGIF